MSHANRDHTTVPRCLHTRVIPLALAAMAFLAAPGTALAATIVPIYTGDTPMYFVDASDSDVVWADNSAVWMRDMATGSVTQVAGGEFGAYPQVTHDRLMWQTLNDYYATSYRRVKLRDEGSVQGVPARPACELDGDRIAYVESGESHYGVIAGIDGATEAQLGYQTYQCKLSYPWAIWQAQGDVRVRDLSSPDPDVSIWSGGALIAVDGDRAVWTQHVMGDSRGILTQRLPTGSLTVVRDTAASIADVDVSGDWIAWVERVDAVTSNVYAYHIPSAQRVRITPAPGCFGHCVLTSTWVAWLQESSPGYGGTVYGCRLTDLLADLPAPVATRPSLATLAGSGITLSFQDLVAAGDSASAPAPNRPAPAGYHLATGTNWDITTDARASGYTDITVPYDPTSLGGAAESTARLFLWKDAAWIDITTSVDTAANTVTGRTYYLSQVAVARPRLPEETASVYRFYNKRSGTHFYTASAEERDSVIAHLSSVFDYEGVAYTYDHAKATQPLYRFFNKRNGSHFYTASWAEVEHVRATWPQIFDFEGPAYNISALPTPGSAVYRFYNNGNGSHFFTASAEERDHVIRTWPNVYTYEGEAFYLPQ